MLLMNYLQVVPVHSIYNIGVNSLFCRISKLSYAYASDDLMYPIQQKLTLNLLTHFCDYPRIILYKSNTGQ